MAWNRCWLACFSCRGEVAPSCGRDVLRDWSPAQHWLDWGASGAGWERLREGGTWECSSESACAQIRKGWASLCATNAVVVYACWQQFLHEQDCSDQVPTCVNAAHCWMHKKRLSHESHHGHQLDLFPVAECLQASKQHVSFNRRLCIALYMLCHRCATECLPTLMACLPRATCTTLSGGKLSQLQAQAVWQPSGTPHALLALLYLQINLQHEWAKQINLQMLGSASFFPFQIIDCAETLMAFLSQPKFDGTSTGASWKQMQKWLPVASSWSARANSPQHASLMVS